MGDLQDIDTSDLDEMDEENSEKDTDTQPSDTEGTNGSNLSPLTSSAFTEKVEKILDKDTQTQQSVAESKPIGIDTNSDISSTLIRSDNAIVEAVPHVTTEISSKDRSHKKFTNSKMLKEEDNKTKKSSQDAATCKENLKSYSKSEDFVHGTTYLPQENISNTKLTGKSKKQELFFGTGCETFVGFREIEELSCEDDKIEAASTEVEDKTKSFEMILQGKSNINILSNYDECNVVESRPEKENNIFAFGNKSGRIENIGTELSNKKTEKNLHVERENAELHEIPDSLKTEHISDSNVLFYSNSGAAISVEEANFDDKTEFEKDLCSGFNDETPFDDVDGSLANSLPMDKSDMNPLFVSEFKMGWDNNKSQEVAEPEGKDSACENIYSQNWKQEIIEWNLRDFDVEARQNVMPQIFNMPVYTVPSINKEERNKVKMEFISEYGKRLSEEIINDILESLSEVSQSSEKEVTNDFEKEYDKEYAVQHDANLENSSSAPDIYTCASYSDFCRELEASGPVNKGIGISFEQKSDDSISIDDKMGDEFPVIQISEPDELTKDQNEESEKLIQDISEKAEIDVIGGTAECLGATKDVESVSIKALDIYNFENAIVQKPVMEVFESENLPSLEYCEDIVLNTGLSEDQEYHEIMAALANEEYNIDDQGFVAGTAQDYGLVPGSDIDEGTASLEYSDGNIFEDECKYSFMLHVCVFTL